MGRFCGAFLAFIFILFSASGWSDDNQALECSADRYQDFIQLRKNREKAVEQRQKGATAVREAREARARELEAARKLYRRPEMRDDPKLEAQWLEQQKAARAKHEVNRQQYVQNRDHELKSRCKGVQIPEMLEFDLQDY